MKLYSRKLKKISYISGGNFKVSSLKKFLIFFSYHFKKYIHQIFLIVSKNKSTHFSSQYSSTDST